MAEKRKLHYNNAEEMLADLERVSAGEPPLYAKQSYDLSSLSDLEKGGKVSASTMQSRAGVIPLSAQNTIDIGGLTLQQRLMDPIVLSLAAALLLALILILILFFSR